MFPTFLHEIQLVTTAIPRIPRIAHILVLKKIALRENCVGGTTYTDDSTNVEFPHLRVHRPKFA